MVRAGEIDTNLGGNDYFPRSFFFFSLPPPRSLTGTVSVLIPQLQDLDNWEIKTNPSEYLKTFIGFIHPALDTHSVWRRASLKQKHQSKYYIQIMVLTSFECCMFFSFWPIKHCLRQFLFFPLNYWWIHVTFPLSASHLTLCKHPRKMSQIILTCHVLFRWY